MLRVGLILFLLAAASFADPEALLREYRALGRGRPDRMEFERRSSIIFKFRDMKNEAGRPWLFRAMAAAKRPDESVLTILFLGPVRDQEHLEAVVDHAAKSRNEALIRLLGDQLGKSTSKEVKSWIVEKGLSATNPIVLGAACRAVAYHKMAEAEEPLSKLWPRLARDPKRARLVFEAVRSLGYAQRKAGKAVLADAAAHRSATVRLGAAEVLATGTAPDEASRTRVKALLKDPEWTVRRALVELAGWSKNADLAPELIEALENDPRLACRYSARRALREISGRDLEYDASSWREWLKDHQREGPAKPRTYSFARYYGTEIVSSNVCFVVDLSGSMKKGGKGVSRIKVARQELIRALESLAEKTRFNIVTFSDEAEVWKRKNGVLATKRNVDAAREWIEKNFRAAGQTNTYAALRLAFRANPDLDTVFLLSDGSPSVDAYESRTGMLCAIYEWNWNRRVVIHTITLSLSELVGKSKSDWGENFMRNVARFTQGECRIVTRPPR
jgi:Mg-chelatase subunit ChlD